MHLFGLAWLWWLPWAAAWAPHEEWDLASRLLQHMGALRAFCEAQHSFVQYSMV